MSKRKDRKNALMESIPITDVEDKPMLRMWLKDHDFVSSQIDALWLKRQNILRDIRREFGPGPFKVKESLVIVDNKGNTFFLRKVQEN